MLYHIVVHESVVDIVSHFTLCDFVYSTEIYYVVSYCIPFLTLLLYCITLACIILVVKYHTVIHNLSRNPDKRLSPSQEFRNRAKAGA